MLDILWISFGYFTQPRETIKDLREFSSKKILTYGFTISVMAMLSVFLGSMLDQRVAPHTVFFQLIAYYIGVFFFIGSVLLGIIFYKKEIDIPRFLGVYLSSDLPLLLLLPFSLLTLLLPSIGGLVGFMSFVLGILVWWYKILVISESFNIPSSKAILLTILPFILMTIWIVTSAITVFNYSVTFF